MDCILFEEWILEMDTKFTIEKKKEALIIDNYPAPPTINNLKSIGLIFLPPNTTSKLQPMDQGVICSLKAYYKALAFQRLVVAIDKGKDVPVFSILDAMKMLDLASQKVLLRKQEFRKINRNLPNWMTMTPSVMSIVPLLTYEELIEEVMNAVNGDDADDREDDDDDALLNPVCPKVSDI